MRQRGMTLVGLMGVLIIAAFFLMLAIRLVPVYIEAFKVSGAMDALNEDNLRGMAEVQVKHLLVDRLENFNDVHRVKEQDIRVQRTDRGYIVRVRYEARVPMLGNVDAVVSFDETEELLF